MTYRFPGERAGIDWDRVALGHESDRAIAKRLGCDASTVWHARTSRGIAAAPITERAHAPGWTRWDDVTDLGVSTDREIAERLGVPMRVVRHARWRRGIPCASKPGPTPKDIAEAKRLKADGWSAREVAEVFRVSKSTILRWYSSV